MVITKLVLLEVGCMTERDGTGRDGTGQNGKEQMFFVMFEHRHCCFFFFIFHSLLSPSKPNIHRHPFSSLTHHNPPSPPSPHLVSEFSRILNDHRNPHHDLELSLNALSTQISTYLVEQVLKRCKNLGLSAHRFILWAKTIPGFRHSAESYHILIDILGSSKQYAVLWDFLIEMRESKCCDIGPEIFWVIFQVYSRANLPREAIQALNRMVEFGIKPSVHDLDQLLYTLCKRKHVNYLEALCKGGKVDEAYKIFREMGSNGVERDACTYSIFIRTYCEVDDLPPFMLSSSP
ncbi:hypothetical protein ACFX12_003701 [Malus domestica]